MDMLLFVIELVESSIPRALAEGCHCILWRFLSFGLIREIESFATVQVRRTSFDSKPCLDNVNLLSLSAARTMVS